MNKNYKSVIGIRPIKMKPLVIAMAKAFQKEYGTRIFPDCPSAILLPITRKIADEDGLIQTPNTNIFLKG